MGAPGLDFETWESTTTSPIQASRASMPAAVYDPLVHDDRSAGAFVIETPGREKGIFWGARQH